MLKTIIVILTIPLLSVFAHRYYVSVTQVEYIEDKKAVQIITKIDADDLEVTLQELYNQNLKLTTIDEDPSVAKYLKRYLDEKLTVKINTKSQELKFVGKAYENDLVICYLEIQNIDAIHTIEISNTILFGLFPKQKNMVKTDINSEVNSLIFTPETKNQHLNFK
ncbi:MAG: DUF6702 family protein [Psychroserpens sp.]|uniref:DUF6702 family protein n=1 Tax=Psychroserpens sp. TaxID=2020870 RepID=UPI003C768CFB